MITIISLVAILIIAVVVINSIQQHKVKLEKDKRAKASRLKLIINDNEELLVNLMNIPPSPLIYEVLCKRSLNTIKQMKQAMPETKNINSRIKEYETRVKAATEATQKASGNNDNFSLPGDEKQLITILKTIKKVRIVLRSEQSKGTIDVETFQKEDQRLDLMQLKINIDTLIKRANQAYSNGMTGSARQFLEKALNSVSSSSLQGAYKEQKKEEIEDRLQEISNELRNTNAEDRAKKAKSEEDDLDMLFQPKKKW